MPGRSRNFYWQQVKDTVNTMVNSNYTTDQVINRWNFLMTAYHVSKMLKLYICIIILIVLILFDF